MSVFCVQRSEPKRVDGLVDGRVWSTSRNNRILQKKKKLQFLKFIYIYLNYLQIWF